LSASYPLYKPLGDSAVTVVLGEGISRSLSAHVLSVADALHSAGISSVNEIVPAYATLTVFFNPLGTEFDKVVDAIRRISEGVATDSVAHIAAPRLVRIPVTYDGEDLADVAERTGHSIEDVIRLHAEREYYVYVIGFVPGFAYLGEIDPSLALPRRSAPRKKVPAGSVAIAETQTGVYPFSTPGGWNLLGRTDTKMFDPARDEPALLKVGDRVVFERIG
jgi:KipI family sensor histidine kinase inhibitor